MLSGSKFDQLTIEGEGKNLYIYIYLREFSKKLASRVMDRYIKKYKDKDFEGLYLTFIDRNIAGDFLSYCRNNPTNENIIKPLAGTKVFKAFYDFNFTSKQIEDATVIC